MAFRAPYSVSSNYARENAAGIAAAASAGLLSTRDFGSGYTRMWRVTPSGGRYLSDYWATEKV